MSHQQCGAGLTDTTRRFLRALGPLALCLVSIPVLAKTPHSDPLAYQPIRPRPAHAVVLQPGKPRREARATPKAPLTPKPEVGATPVDPSWLWLDATPGDNAVLFRTPAATPRKDTRVTIMLHGMCDVPQNECPSFASATSGDWLICPQASLGCNGGGATWNWKNRVERVEAATGRALDGRGVAANTPRTLIGFSLGASTALEVAQNGHEHYDALVLIAGRIHPDAKKLKAHGVQRIVLAAGDFDGSAPHLRREANRLARAGIETRFMSLGRVGHQFARDMPAWLEDALSWAERRAPNADASATEITPSR
ncbi:MAG: alpha/beta hydrolase [Polyangiaceae bacterium]